jgi:hypothetical protein
MTNPSAHSIMVGILSPKDAFTTALLELLEERGVSAEWCEVRELDFQAPCRYRVILDRISHCYEFYLPYLKHAALQGCYVISNPFRFLADDKFFNYAWATQMGVAIPRTILLPSREYDERVLSGADLHNLQFPVDWERVVEHIGFPAILKPYDGYGWREVHKVENLPHLLSLYNESMMDVMMLQEFIDFEHYVRCFVIGQKWVLPIHYLPHERRYIVDHEHLSPELGETIVRDCLLINQALGYDINTVEFAIRDGVPYAIDFMNPVPDAKPEVISRPYFSWLINRVADFMEEIIADGRSTPYRLTQAEEARPDPPGRQQRKRWAAWR